MGNPRGFLTVKRREGGYRPVEERINDYHEVEVQLDENERKEQASRCMDCGVAFCHWGCPVGNVMPEWQDAMYRGDWKSAYENLQETNNFPEFTGRVCPALCEASCVLALNDEPVTIRQNEWYVIDKAWELGLVKPQPPKQRTGKTVAVIGGGPAGLAAADNLNKLGHSVTLFEAEAFVGGFIRYGIPDFKLDKKVIERRVNLMAEEGVVFKTSTRVGTDITTAELKANFDAVCITIGARQPRDLACEGRETKGIHFAYDYLSQQNKSCSGEKVCLESLIQALDKNVVVIGGGDTGSDCVGTANRQGAHSVYQLELLPQPPEHRTDDMPWPLWPRLHKVSSSHKEGCIRLWSVLTKRIESDSSGNVCKIHAVKVEWEKDESGRFAMKEVPGSDFTLEADLVLLAMGFVHPEHDGPVNDLDLEKDGRGNIKVDESFKTSLPAVFAAGDARRGASLVVYAIDEGRRAASAIDDYLTSQK
ncbi:MAG: glutamate synthase subunit beta [Spirochaetes bacterium]|jgi:glutamate synthase (NADPH/NADH) small chain|nr:glutamate synthase subunit beta [Spirochaetota bacterium]